uniref:NADH-ubiquinone oxidoreductase chain 4L n=1 Tax=Histeroidea sp. 5 KM-2017 TaxID=2219438 RepID=A0A346RGU9_9COLE|nr:NADH dehydrogenase subunit 4L [Histeroidea sp. 5 KM-2017]
MTIYTGAIMYMSGIYVFSSKRKHLLTVLLSLEFIVLSLFILFMDSLFLMDYSFYNSMVFLIMSVCEGALGLSLLVSLMRVNGNDYFMTHNILW